MANVSQTDEHVLLSMRLKPKSLSIMIHSQTKGSFVVQVLVACAKGLQLNFAVDGQLREREIEIRLPFPPIFAGFTQLNILNPSKDANLSVLLTRKRIIDMRDSFLNSRKGIQRNGRTG